MKERQKKIYIFLDEWIIFNWGVHTVDVYEFVRNARFQRVLFSLLELELRLNVWEIDEFFYLQMEMRYRGKN